MQFDAVSLTNELGLTGLPVVWSEAIANQDPAQGPETTAAHSRTLHAVCIITRYNAFPDNFGGTFTPSV